MFLEEIRRRQRELVELVKRIVEIKRDAYDPRGGRTIGLVVPDHIRERLERMRFSHRIRSYRHTVLVAVKLGLVELERAGASPAVESLRLARREPDRSPVDSVDFDFPDPHPVPRPPLPVHDESPPVHDDCEGTPGTPETPVEGAGDDDCDEDDEEKDGDVTVPIVATVTAPEEIEELDYESLDFSSSDPVFRI